MTCWWRSAALRTGLRVGDLAAQIGWERSRLSHQLRRMEERGLTERRASTEDGRTTNVVLTARGRQAIAYAAPGHVDLVRSLFFDPLPENLLGPFTAALEHIHVNLNHNSSLPPAPRWHLGEMSPRKWRQAVGDVITGLMEANLLAVFDERDPHRRAAAIAVTYAPDVQWVDRRRRCHHRPRRVEC